MDKLKEAFKKNVIWFIILIILIIILIVRVVINIIDGNEIYHDPMLKDEKIPYINYNYQDNEYKVITMDEYDIYNQYYKKYLNNIINNPKEAFEMLSDKTKKERFKDDYKEYENYLKKTITIKTKNNVVEKYYRKDNKIVVVDSEDYMYEFEERGVWNYQVTISGRIYNN